MRAGSVAPNCGFAVKSSPPQNGKRRDFGGRCSPKSGKQHTYRGAGKQALRALYELVSVCYIEFIPAHSAPGPGAQLRRYDRLACLRSPVALNYLPESDCAQCPR